MLCCAGSFLLLTNFTADDNKHPPARAPSESYGVLTRWRYRLPTGNPRRQVYRATLLTGEAVAVKVQRPDVLESVTLDLYVIRLLLLFLSRWDGVRDTALSILAVIDNWADRFLQELDYLKEAANGDR